MSNKDFLPVKSDVIFRLFFADERARRDMASREKRGVKHRDYKFAKSMMADNEPLEKIIKHTSLTHGELDELRDTV